MAAYSECRVLHVLSLSSAVSCNLPPRPLWCSWDARIQGKKKKKVSFFISFELYSAQCVWGNMHSSCQAASSCMYSILWIFAHAGSHRAQRRQRGARKRWREGEFIMWYGYSVSDLMWLMRLHDNRMNLLYAKCWFYWVQMIILFDVVSCSVSRVTLVHLAHQVFLGLWVCRWVTLRIFRSSGIFPFLVLLFTCYLHIFFVCYLHI